MKTKQMRCLAVLALTLALGFTGCSKDGDDPIVTPVSTTGSLTIAFNASELSTKSLNKTATDAEKKVNNVHVFVYNANGALEKVAAFVEADFTKTNDIYVLSAGKKIDGLGAGGKKVAVGVNLSDAIVGQIQAAAAAGLTSAHTATLAELTAADNFAMFSDLQTATIVVGQTAIPDGTFAVDRLVAKASVKTKKNLSMAVAGGTISDIQYAIQNINKKIYPLKPTTFDDSTIDYSFTSPVLKNVEEMPDNATDDTNHSYMTEYTPNSPVTTNFPTYVRIRCAFAPEKYITDAAAGTTSTAYTAGTTFYTLSMTDGKVAYFLDETVAEAYFNANSSLISNPDTKTFANLRKEYVDGNVDYGIFLHKTANTFDIVRNTYYIVTITGINGLGEPTTVPQITPKEQGSLIQFTLDIKDWTGVDLNDEQIS